MKEFRTRLYNFNRIKDHYGFWKAFLFTFIYSLYYLEKFWLEKFERNKTKKLLKIKLFNGKSFYISSKDTGLSFDLYIAKIREPLACQKIIEILKNKKFHCFLDIGANIGYYSVILSDNYKKIICLEPNRQSIVILKKNISLNLLEKKTQILEGAVHYKKTPLFMLEKEDFNLSRVSEVKGDYSLVAYYFEDLLVKYPTDLLKMDIEGFEYQLFNHSLLKLKKYFPKYLFLEIHFRHKDYKANEQILKNIKDLGYKIEYSIWEMKGPHYLAYRFNYWKRLSQIIKKIQIGDRDYILSQNEKIDTFIQKNKGILEGEIGALEFIFVKD